MKLLATRQLPIGLQCLFSTAMVVLVSLLCFTMSHYLGYKTVALLLLMTVSIIAMLFEIWPVLIGAVMSALIWNFFFIPPIFTFHIGNAEDGLMFLLYFVMATVSAVLTFKIRKAESKVRDKEEKENTIKLYNTLLNSLSHELRTPIATILGSVDALKESGNKLSASNQSALLDEIDKASLRLNRQVENLLSMSRLESGMLKPKEDWCDINELIYALVHKMPPAPDHHIAITSSEHLPLFKLDAGLLEQVLYNLVHNALQYTPPHTTIQIQARHEDNGCIITVSDNGKGFPPAAIDKVFDKFYRLPHSKAGGSGLGLSIAKGFVEAMQGSIQLQNQTKGGALFTISIPAATSYLNHLNNE